MLEDVEVREIISGISSTEEIQKFHEWKKEKHLENQATFDSGVISMDIEDVKDLYYDEMRMDGKIVISREYQEYQSFQRHLDDRSVSGLMEDCWN